MSAHVADPDDYARGRTAVRQRRILGDLHLAVSTLLIECARESVAPETGDALGTRHEIYRVCDLATELQASLS